MIGRTYVGNSVRGPDPPRMDLTELTNTSLLGIYLNDHLAGATAGVALIERPS